MFENFEWTEEPAEEAPTGRLTSTYEVGGIVIKSYIMDDDEN